MVTLLRRQPEAGVEAKATPSLNVPVSQIVEPAIEPRSANWNEYFDRPRSVRKFRFSAQVKGAEL